MGGYRTYFDYNGYGQLCILSHEDAGRREEEHYSYNEWGSVWKDGWERKGKEQPFGYTGYRYDEMSGSYFAQGREYDPKAGRFLAQDVIGGSIGIPKTLNRYVYCWGNPLILVDLDGRFPSVSEAGDAGAWTKHIMEEYIEDASQAFVKGVSDVKDGIARGISEMVEGATAFYEEHEEEIELGAAITAAVVIFAPLPLSLVAGPMLFGGAVGGVLGGSANVMTGGSFHNGFVGGAVNGFITTAGTLAGRSDLGYYRSQ